MIPKDLRDYLDNLNSNYPNHRYIQECSDRGKKAVDDKIDSLLTSASKATGLVPEKLLKALDFDKRDFDGERIQSLFAVLRTINILTTQYGFSEITPLRRKLKQREADLLGTHERIKFAVEVARSSDQAFRLAGANLNRYIKELWERKENQIRSSMVSNKCERGILVIVLDSEPVRSDLVLEINPPFPKWISLSGAVELAYHNISDPIHIHLLLSTGFESSGQAEVAIFPPLSKTETI